MKKPLLALPANRVRRGYLGGRELDRLQREASPRDGQRPEDWIASTVEARNPGLAEIPGEGLAFVHDSDNAKRIVKELFAAAPEYYLGQAHHAALGTELGFLAKLLDSSIRLHIQAHPTAAFAQEHLNSHWGKLETYVVLSIRPECEGYILLGFQRPPKPEEWERIVLEQDMKAMHACFDKIPVKPGEVWLVPGGLPHAIGEGVLMLEVMEPSDLVVRCEFEREGIVVPPPARFMGRDPRFAMKIFDYSPLAPEAVRKRCQIAPRAVPRGSGFASAEELIGPQQTSCFTIARFTASSRAELASSGKVGVGIVAAGRGSVSAEGVKLPLEPGAKFLLAAGCERAVFEPAPGETLTILLCEPGIPINPKG